MINLSGLEFDSSSSAAERVFGSGQLIEVIKIGQTRDHIDRYAPEITLPGEHDRHEICGSIGEKAGNDLVVIHVLGHIDVEHFDLDLFTELILGALVRSGLHGALIGRGAREAG